MRHLDGDAQMIKHEGYKMEDKEIREAIKTAPLLTRGKADEQEWLGHEIQVKQQKRYRRRGLKED